MTTFQYHSTHLKSARRKGLAKGLAKGFTLIEILIVIAIIAILAAILFPVFSRVREEARKASCASNMKQLGLAFTLYSNDNGGRLPGPGTYNTFSGLTKWDPGTGNWVAGTGALADAMTQEPTGTAANVEAGAIFQYVREPKVYVCPSNASGQVKKLTYSMNCAVSGISNTRIRTPSDIVLLVDEDKANDGYFYAVDNADSGAAGDSTDALTKVHNGGGNLLFVDGHVKFFTFDSFPLDKTAIGKANKWRDTGSPRFHDPAFGPYSSNGNFATVGAHDYCDASKRTKTTTPVTPPAK